MQSVVHLLTRLALCKGLVPPILLMAAVIIYIVVGPGRELSLAPLWIVRPGSGSSIITHTIVSMRI
jgi:hypothetical protein